MSSTSGSPTGNSKTSGHATTRTKILDGIVEGSIVSLGVAKCLADASSVPYLSVSFQLLLSVLGAVSRARDNTGLLTSLAERAVQVVATIEAQLKDITPSPDVLGHVRILEEVLKSIEDCVNHEGKRRFLWKVVLSKRARGQVDKLKEKLQDALFLFQIKTSLTTNEILEKLLKEQSSAFSRIEASLACVCDASEAKTNVQSGSNVPIKIVRYEDLDLSEELYLDSNYQIYTADVNSIQQRMAVTKIFRGPQAEKYWRDTIEFSKRMIHPHLLHIKGVSPEASASPFIVFGASCKGSVKAHIASVLLEDLYRSTCLGFEIVGGLSSGLNFLSTQSLCPSAIGDIANFEVFTTVKETVVISFKPSVLTGIFNEDPLNEDNSLEETLWRVFNNLCSKTFTDANCILYQEQPERKDMLFEEPAIKHWAPQHEAGIKYEQSRDKSDQPEEKSDVSLRRELVWAAPPRRGSTTLASIAENYKNALVIRRPGEAGLLRQLSARRTPRTRHRCKGYRKEEITLTISIQQSAIVSHLTPAPRERCNVCGEEVEDAGTFHCICGATEDDKVSPTIKCSICSTWQHSQCVEVPVRGPFSCNTCVPISPPTGIHSSIATNGVTSFVLNNSTIITGNSSNNLDSSSAPLDKEGKDEVRMLQPDTRDPNKPISFSESKRFLRSVLQASNTNNTPSPKHVAPRIQPQDRHPRADPTEILNNWAQASGVSVQYQATQTGPQMAPTWTALVFVNGVQCGCGGSGPNRGAAKSAAAGQALQAIAHSSQR